MNRKVLTIAFTLALFGLVSASPVWANEAADTPADQAVEVASIGGSATYVALPALTDLTVTVARPVQIPGHVLQPGQYSFRLIDSDNAVAVSRLDGSKFYGNYFIIPTSRDRAGDGAVYTQESQGGGFDRIASWYYPGELNGYSFIYPKTKHAQVAKAFLKTR